jgi:hypothetical protein
MSGRSSPRQRRSDGLTGELFSAIPAPAPELPESMDYRAPVAELVAEMLGKAKSKKIDRWDVAARMSRLAGHETSKAIIDSYTAASRDECNLPLWKAPIMELACEERGLAEWHAGVLGGRILWGRDVLDAELGKVQRQIDELRAQERVMRETLRRQR